MVNEEVMRDVLIVESDEFAGLVSLSEVVELAFPGVRVCRATSLVQARAYMAAENFFLVLIDIDLTDGSGIELIREVISNSVHECYPVVITHYDDDKHLFAALKAGAQGYLLKDQSEEKLTNQLRGIVRGEPPLSPRVLRRMLTFFRPQVSPSKPPSKRGPKALTKRETEVLQFLAYGFNRNRIAGALGITPYTVAGYIKVIYRKLEISGRAEAALCALKLGLMEKEGRLESGNISSPIAEETFQ